MDGRDDHTFVGFSSAITVGFEVRGDHTVCGFAILILTVEMFMTQWKAYVKWTDQVGRQCASA